MSKIIIQYLDNLGSLHREDGPAIIYDSGNQYWYSHGSLHRDGGPAIELYDGSKEWYKRGFCHREDGPAVMWMPTENNPFRCHWYVNGEHMRSPEQFQLYTECTDEELMFLILKYGDIK